MPPPLGRPAVPGLVPCTPPLLSRDQTCGRRARSERWADWSRAGAYPCSVSYSLKMAPPRAADSGVSRMRRFRRRPLIGRACHDVTLGCCDVIAGSGPLRRGERRAAGAGGRRCRGGRPDRDVEHAMAPIQNFVALFVANMYFLSCLLATPSPKVFTGKIFFGCEETVALFPDKSSLFRSSATIFVVDKAIEIYQQGHYIISSHRKFLS